ncbi:hypothetical protein [Xylophilus sp.]|uniref:hypothetical protein n=1 Tax=Xylophilus sp. TaxID=2653893 RepID=UPI0013B8FABE|nr:hypothetical protein [Xylophilus sp.]KAF1042878.1 MAG: hypothetical protein GAK38_04159 [Xylophilus sp.]
MATALTLLAVGFYASAGVLFLALAKAAGRADRAEDRQHVETATSTRRKRLALLASAGRKRYSPLSHA